MFKRLEKSIDNEKYISGKQFLQLSLNYKPKNLLLADIGAISASDSSAIPKILGIDFLK